MIFGTTSACAQIATFELSWSVPSPPAGVGVDPTGNVWVGCYDDSVRKYSSGGTLLLTFGGNGSGPGKFVFPVDFAFGLDGSTYISDYVNHRVEKFTASGVYLTSWNVPGLRAYGIDRDDLGNLYVADFSVGTSHVWKFDPEGVLLGGPWNCGSRTAGLTVTDTVVYAVSTDAGTVQRFDHAGNSLGTFSAPFAHQSGGLVADSNGHLLLTSTSNLVSAFLDGGVSAGSIGSPGSTDGRFNNPVDLAITPGGLLYVADNGNSRIQRLSMGCVPPPSPSPGLKGWQASNGKRPEQSCPTWQSVGASATLDCQRLILQTNSNGDNAYFIEEAPDLIIPDPFVFEARVRLVSGSSTLNARAPIAVLISTGGGTGTCFFIGSDEVFLLAGNLTRGATASIETDDALHTYRLAITGSTVTVQVDGVLTLTGTTFTDAGTFASVPQILWGESSSAANGLSEWQYVVHNGSTVPCDVLSGATLCETFDGDSVAVPRYWLAQANACGGPNVDGGELVLAQSGCGGGPSLGTNYPAVRISGDFDVTAKFRLPDFTVPSPAGDRVAQLTLGTMSGGYYATIERYNRLPGACNPSTKNYKSFFLTSANCDASVHWSPTTDEEGRFRITRVGTVVRMFYWAGNWVQHNVAISTNEDVYVALSAGNASGTSGFDARFDDLCIVAGGITDVPRHEQESVTRASLEMGRPNPFRGSVTLKYRTPGAARVEVRIHDLAGRTVRLLENGVAAAGPHELEWNGRDDHGVAAAPGAYFAHLRVDGYTLTRMIVLLK